MRCELSVVSLKFLATHPSSVESGDCRAGIVPGASRGSLECQGRERALKFAWWCGEEGDEDKWREGEGGIEGWVYAAMKV